VTLCASGVRHTAPTLGACIRPPQLRRTHGQATVELVALALAVAALMAALAVGAGGCRTR
jgi:hypothetical protein